MIKFPDYTNSIMNVSNSFLHYYGIKTDYPGQKSLDKILQDKNPKHIIYVLLDGMGANLIHEHLKPTDVLRKYMLESVTSVHPPTTVAATNSVLSGLPPITTGYLGWVQYFKEEDINLTVFLNSDFYDNSIVPKENLAQKYLSYENIISKIGRLNPNIKTNGFFPSFAVNGSASFKEEIEKTLMFVHNVEESFSYVYWTQPDLTEHQFGIKSLETKDMIQSLSNDFEELIDNAPDDTVIVCIADHGLTDIEEINLYEYTELVSMLKRNPSIEPRTINFFINDGLHTMFQTEFEKHFSSKFKLYSKQEILDSKLFGDGVIHPMIDSFLGDFIGVAIDKYMFTLSDSKHYKGHHAGLLEDEMMVPLIVYSNKK